MESSVVLQSFFMLWNAHNSNLQSVLERIVRQFLRWFTCAEGLSHVYLNT